MGIALAEAAARAGWEVDLVLGPTEVKVPEHAHLTVHRVVTGAEMLSAIEPRFPACALLIMTAAVTDFRPARKASHKIKKNETTLTMAMEPVADILQTMAARKEQQLIVGFAAETRDVEAYARSKLERKRCDFVVANDITEDGAGFGVETNRVLLVQREGPSVQIGPTTKREIARVLMSLFAEAVGGRLTLSKEGASRG